MHARSASRLGRSDFGQNRRNLAELWTALDDREDPWLEGPVDVFYSDYYEAE